MVVCGWIAAKAFVNELKRITPKLPMVLAWHTLQKQQQNMQESDYGNQLNPRNNILKAAFDEDDE